MSIKAISLALILRVESALLIRAACVPPEQITVNITVKQVFLIIGYIFIPPFLSFGFWKTIDKKTCNSNANYLK